MFQKKIISLLLSVLLNFSIFAQTDLKFESPKNKVSPEIKEKAFDLLIGLAREAEQFSLPSNRIDARVNVANLLWKKDEKAARILFQNAISDLNLLIGQIPTENADSDEEYDVERVTTLANVGRLRKELLLSLAARDEKFELDALQFLSAKNAEGKNIFNDEENLRLELAAKIADSDPQQAYEIAKKNLANGLGNNLFATLESLYKKNAELGAKFARDILSKLKSKESVVGAPTDKSVSANSNMMKSDILNMISSINVWEIQSFLDTIKKLTKQAAKEKKPPILNENEMKETLDVLAQKYINQEYLSAYEVSKVMPEISKYAPASALAIRRKIGQQESATLNNLIKNQNFQNEAEDKSADEILQIIEKYPVAERDNFYFQAAETAFNNGEIEKAKVFHDKMKTKRENDYLDKAIDDAMPLTLAANGDLSQVRQLLTKLKTPEQRIEILAALAMSVAKNGDKKTASALMNEVRSMYSGRMKNRRNLSSVLQIAQSYSVIEPAQGFEILEANTQFFNEIINAAILLGEFNESDAVENDELRLDAVRRASFQNLPNGVELIKNLTAADFDRTINLAERFARPEVRFYARFRIADALLNPQAEENEKSMQTDLNNEEGEY